MTHAAAAEAFAGAISDIVQSRTMSLVEASANVVAGFAIAIVTQMIVFPLAGLQMTLGTNLILGGIFTVVSIARSYLVRRCFEAMRMRMLQ